MASFSKQVSDMFDKKIDDKIMQARKFGLVRIENFMDYEKLFDSLKSGETLWWLDTYCPGHKKWIDHANQAVERGASIKMLVLDPKSAMCDMRATEIGNYYTNENFKKELELFISDFTICKNRHTNKNDASGNVEITFYDGLLGVPCYIVTSKDTPMYAYSSIYLAEPTGVDFPHFYWERGPMCDCLFNYIKRKYAIIKENNPQKPP